MQRSPEPHVRIERAVSLGIALAAAVALFPLTGAMADIVAQYGTRALINSGSALVTVTLALGLSLWISLRGPRSSAAASLSLSLGVGAGTWVLSLSLFALSPSGDRRIESVFAIGLVTGIYLSAWALARCFAHFPSALTLERLTATGLSEAVAQRSLRAIRAGTGVPGALVGIALAATCATLSYWGPALGLPQMQWMSMLALVVLPSAPLAFGLVILDRQRRSADVENGRRLRWFWTGAYGGLALFLALGLIAAVVGDSTALGGPFLWFCVASGFCCVCFAMSVLARGDLDPDLALRRTLVYSAVGLLVTIGFVALLNVLQEYVLGWLGVPPGAAVYLAGGALAVAFGPLQRRLDAWLATRLPGA